MDTVDHASLRMSRTLLVLIAARSVALAWRHGGYFPTGWGAAVLAILLLLAGLAGAGLVPMVRMPRRGVVGIVALVALCGWTIAAIGWAEDRQAASEEAGRTTLYVALVLVGALLAIRRAAVYPMLVAVALIPGITTAFVLAGTDASLARTFDGGRLAGALGYHNGLASLLTAAFWTAMVLAAARNTRWWVAMPLVFASSIALQLAVLTQSRASALTIVLVAILVLLAAPYRWRTLLLGGTALLGVAWNWTALNAPYASAGAEVPTTAVDGIAERIVAGTIPAMVTCVLLVLAGRRAERSKPSRRMRFRFVVPAAVVGVVVAVVATSVVAGRSDERVVAAAWNAFSTKPSSEYSDGNRFLMVSNNGRIVLWITALQVFREHPVTGVGGGNWEPYYYRYRASDAGFVRQPHALTLELLAERGAVGTACFLLAIGLGLVPILRIGARGASARDRTCIVAAACLVCAWLVHAQVDWLWQLPAVTLAPMLALGALLVAPWDGASRPPLRPGVRVGGMVACATIAVVMAIPALAYRHVELSVAHPESASAHLAAADRLFPVSSTVAHARASIAARDGDRRQAIMFSDRAIARGPSHYANFELAADLSRAVGADDRADELDARARALNPR